MICINNRKSKIRIKNGVPPASRGGSAEGWEFPEQFTQRFVPAPILSHFDGKGVMINEYSKIKIRIIPDQGDQEGKDIFRHGRS